MNSNLLDVWNLNSLWKLLSSIKNGDKKNIVCEKILVAAGRKPYVDGLGIEKIGVKLDKNGFMMEK